MTPATVSRWPAGHGVRVFVCVCERACVSVCVWDGVMILHCINSSPEPWESRRSERRGAAITCGSLSLSQHQGSLFVFHYFPEAQSSLNSSPTHEHTHTHTQLCWDIPIFSVEDYTEPLQTKLTASSLPCVYLFSLQVKDGGDVTRG